MDYRRVFNCLYGQNYEHNMCDCFTDACNIVSYAITDIGASSFRYTIGLEWYSLIGTIPSVVWWGPITQEELYSNDR